MQGLATLTIHAHGIPQVQGNHRVGRGKHPKIYDANENLPAWREQLTLLARHQRAVQKIPTWKGAVRLQVTFWLARPLSAPKTIDVWPITRGGGDWDKLARAIGDSLTVAGVIGDDAQIVEAHVLKRYAVSRELRRIYVENVHWEKPGAEISLREIGPKR